MLGGTFDPPHVGHLIVAQDLVERLELDLLLVVPAGRPPHREAVLPAEARLRLVRHAFRGDLRIEVPDLEVRREGPSYTVDTLEELRDRRSPRTLYCVIGADQLRVFPEWHEHERILRRARLAVMARGGEVPEPGPLPADAWEQVEVTRIDVSSTRIRQRLRDGRSIRYLVPESIRREVEVAWGALVDDPVAG